jgi:integrase
VTSSYQVQVVHVQLVSYAVVVGVYTAVTEKATREARDVADGERLEPIGLHESRHCFASMLIASGANAKVIQTVMGHAAIQMTFDRSSHPMPGGLEEAAAAANAYLARMAA